MDEPTSLKVCRKCAVAKPLDQFHKQASNSDGRRLECKPCRRAYRQALRKLTPEQKAAQASALKNRIRKTCTKCNTEQPLGAFPKNPRSIDGHATRCRTCKLEYSRAYAERNSERIKSRNKTYYEANRDQIAERARESREQNAERLFVRRQLRLAFAVEEGEQTCYKCHATKPVKTFPREGSSPNGRAYDCRECRNAARRNRYWANRERELEKNARWRKANPELAKELSRAWYEANRDRANATTRAWREANSERHQATREAWVAANPDYYAEWNERNRESRRETFRKYRQNNPEKNAEATRRRRARERGTTVGPVDLDALWTGECSLCGNEIDEELRWPDPLSKSVDHIIPLARGGSHTQDNLALAHLICNMRKGARLLAD